MSKRDKELGQGKFWEMAFAASIEMTKAVQNSLDIVERSGAEEAIASWKALLDNKVSGRTGLIVSL